MGVSLEELRGAHARRELIFHYQPKVSMVMGGVCGAEALLRWQRPDGRLVPPGEFIPLAESSGFIREITPTMLDRLVADLPAVRAAAPDLVVSINASARDFEGPRLVDAVCRVLDTGAADARELELELTESAVLDAGPEMVERLATLRSRGVSLAMDDFGTGYSSIDTLSRMPFTALKLDQGIIGRMVGSEKDATIVESSVWMAHRLGLDVVAEGIETEVVFRMLQRAGCGIAQGYWLGRPAPLSTFLELVRSGRRWPVGAIGLIHMAVLDHIEWRRALIDYLVHSDATGPVPEGGKRFELDHTDCRLGRWYHGAGRELGALPAFKALAGPHESLHTCGRRLVSAARAGVPLREQRRGLRELSGHAARVIAHLHDVEHSVIELTG